MDNHKKHQRNCIAKKKPSLQSRASYLRSQKYTISERVQVACKASFLNSLCKLLIVNCTLVNPLASCLWAPVSNGNRTEWSPIRSAIIRVINKIGRPRSGSPICLITSMITDRIGRHEVLLPINHNFNKICDIIGYFLNQNTRNSKFCFASSEKKAI